MLECCTKMLDYCDIHCENENGKIAVAFSSCYLEKVVLRRRTPEQVLVIFFKSNHEQNN